MIVHVRSCFLDTDGKISGTETEPDAFRRHLFHHGHSPIRQEGEPDTFTKPAVKERRRRAFLLHTLVFPDREFTDIVTTLPHHQRSFSLSLHPVSVLQPPTPPTSPLSCDVVLSPARHHEHRFSAEVTAPPSGGHSMFNSL